MSSQLEAFTPPLLSSSRRNATYKVYKSNHPLVGLPRITPHVHTRIHKVSTVANPESAISYDIIPKHPKKVSTLTRMLCGACVPAEIRVRSTRWPLRSTRATLCGEGCAKDEVIDDWVRKYRGCFNEGSQVGICLYNFNCWYFADALVQALLDIDDDDESHH